MHFNLGCSYLWNEYLYNALYIKRSSKVLPLFVFIIIIIIIWTEIKPVHCDTIFMTIKHISL